MKKTNGWMKWVVGTWCSVLLVMLGVTLRSHSVLSAGSVATKDLEPYTIYQGNPAMPVRERIIEA